MSTDSKQAWEYVVKTVSMHAEKCIPYNTLTVTSDGSSVYVVVRSKPTEVLILPQSLPIDVLSHMSILSSTDYRPGHIDKTMPGFMLGRDNDEISELIYKEQILLMESLKNK